MSTVYNNEPLVSQDGLIESLRTYEKQTPFKYDSGEREFTFDWRNTDVVEDPVSLLIEIKNICQQSPFYKDEDAVYFDRAINDPYLDNHPDDYFNWAFSCYEFELDTGKSFVAYWGGVNPEQFYLRKQTPSYGYVKEVEIGFKSNNQDYPLITFTCEEDGYNIPIDLKDDFLRGWGSFRIDSTWVKRKDGFAIWNDIVDKPKLATEEFVENALSSKQDTLISGTSIKTINGNKLLGSGNIDVSGGSDMILIDYETARFDDVLAAVDYDYKNLTKPVVLINYPTFKWPMIVHSATVRESWVNEERVVTIINLTCLYDYHRYDCQIRPGDTGFSGYDPIYRFEDSLSSVNSENAPSLSLIKRSLADKQDKLVSGTSIKTVNDASLLGSGNIDIDSAITIVYGESSYFDVVDAFESAKSIKLIIPVNNSPLFNNDIICEPSVYFESGSDTVLMCDVVLTGTSANSEAIISVSVDITENWTIDLNDYNEPFRVKQWMGSFNIEIPYCTEDISNTSIPKTTFSISDEEGDQYQIVGMIAYEIFDAVSGGNRLNAWPVCQFTGNGQKELNIRWMCGGTTRKTARRISAWILLKRR